MNGGGKDGGQAPKTISPPSEIEKNLYTLIFK